MVPIVVGRKHLNRNVASAGSCLRWFNTVQPNMSGKNTSSEMAVGGIPGKRQGLGASAGMENLESLVSRKVTHQAGIVHIVFDDQQYLVPCLQLVTIVIDPFWLVFSYAHARSRDG